ncbi:ABC transporter ATP-binding protein/permease [Cyanobacterium sp. IPPAS B-1200]|uniref:ABC transporter ATP-binding protein/permease n=1 Tax=Cyanobacterium sp. IPPAS B-1200 TaxID=1562720 RepID=UPI00085285B4|nr:ABC transporter ATP-binding protein/permease [Cyanobacterium sp. IPPAS B-1200]OEJ77653.1 ABC transporter ATP-binding protein [Cyanobacterium sp. IPPAS B-1200]
MNEKVNLNIFKKFWNIARLYWLGKEKKGAFTLLILLGLLLIGYTQLSVLLNRNQGELISTLAAKDEAIFWSAVRSFLTVLLIYVPLFASFSYVQSKLGLYWRKWLTENFLGRYFANRSFYQLTAKYKEIDNPDQRISEDIRGFTQDSLLFLLVVVQSVLQVIAFSAVLWSISQQLVIFLLVYAIAGTIITTGVFGQKLINLNFAQLKKEANFRFGLVRVRENSESIAFYQGEKQEENHLKNLFNDVYQNFNSLIVWQELYLGLFVNTFEFLPYVIPAIVVAPSVLSGELEVGKVSEATGAFARVFFSLNIIVSRFQSLTSFAAGVNRLSTFSEFLQAENEININSKNKPTIDTVTNGKLATTELTLQTPNYQNTLFNNLSLELPPQQGLLIMGSSGCGKSSFLRAIAGLWNSGTGVIYRPELEEMLFLPQRPYMIIGTLRQQLTYPSLDKSIDDQELQNILDIVNLGDLATRFGGFDVEKDWGELLSLGEQQRVAFARIFINKPKYVILDEATSALDIDNEARLYHHLTLQKITYISVGHRESLNNYHQSMIKFKDDKSIAVEN